MNFTDMKITSKDDKFDVLLTGMDEESLHKLSQFVDGNKANTFVEDAQEILILGISEWQKWGNDSDRPQINFPLIDVIKLVRDRMMLENPQLSHFGLKESKNLVEDAVAARPRKVFARGNLEDLERFFIFEQVENKSVIE